MKIAILLAIVLPFPVLASDLIGSVVPPYPDGLIGRQGACIAHSRGIQHTCDYSIGILEDSKGKPKTIVGKRFRRRDGPKSVFWTVTDVMPYPDLPKGYYLAIAMCRNNGQYDTTIMAAVRVVEEAWFREVILARRFDMDTEKFVEITSTGVECANESWGAD